MNKKNYNKSLKLLSSLVIFAFALSFISAAELFSNNITIVTPAASGSMTGTAAVYNCTIPAGYTDQNFTRSQAWLVSAGATANTTLYASGFVKNQSSTLFNATIDTTKIEDGNDYTFTCQLWNGTNYLNATRSGITINNGVPPAPTSLIPSSNTVIQTAQTLSLSSTVIDANTTSCTYTFYRGGSSLDAKSSSGSATYLVNNCSFSKTFADASDNGIYYWTTIASDGTDTTASAANILNIQIPGAAGSSSTTTSSGHSSTSNKNLMIIIGAIVLLAILIGAGISLSNKPSKRKRRK